jgi:hypothetical protein
MLAVGDVLPTVHVLLDALTSWGPAQDGPGSVDADAIELAVRRLPTEALDVSVMADANTVDVDVDFSVLLGAALLSMKWLVGELADATGRTEDEVLSEVRDTMTAPGA